MNTGGPSDSKGLAEATLGEYFPIVYDDLRRMARRQLLGEQRGHTLQTTALVNEVYIRFASLKGVRWKNRAHFLGAAAELMRHVLVDYARTRKSLKRGGGVHPVTFEEGHMLGGSQDLDLVALDHALRRLGEIDPRQARIVEMRFFAGMTIEEISDAIELSPTSIKREWNFARAWLKHELRHSAPPDPAQNRR